jgi:hypothetical protein
VNGRAENTTFQVLTHFCVASRYGCCTEKAYENSPNMNSKKISSRDHLPSKNTMKSKGTTPTDNLTLVEKMFASHMDSMRFHQTDASARVVARNRGHHRRMDLRCIVEDDESFRHLMTHPFHATRVQKRNEWCSNSRTIRYCRRSRPAHRWRNTSSGCAL